MNTTVNTHTHKHIKTITPHVNKSLLMLVQVQSQGDVPRNINMGLKWAVLLPLCVQQHVDQKSFNKNKQPYCSASLSLLMFLALLISTANCIVC